MADKALNWDTTDSSNGSIDGNDISEGCAPGGLNNALRGVVGALARLIHSLTGEKTTTGSANAHTLATGISYAAAAEMLVAFTAGYTNTGATTLSVDSIGSKSLKLDTSTALVAGNLVAGRVYLASYEATAGVWILLNPSGGIFQGDAINMADALLTRAKLKDYSETVNAIGSIGGGTQDIDLELGNVVTATVDTSETTFTFSNPAASGSACSFTLILTNGGSQTVNWPASVQWSSGTVPTLTSSGVDKLVFETVDGGTIWYGGLSGVAFA